MPCILGLPSASFAIPYAKSWLIGKDSDAGRDWGQEEKGMTEDEMAGWHHWLDGRESEWTPGVGDGQGGLACCDSWSHKESDTTEPLTWPDLKVQAVRQGSPEKQTSGNKRNLQDVENLEEILKIIFGCAGSLLLCMGFL